MSTLTAAAIQAAALSLVEEEGPAKLTMRRLADRLGVEAPSLYHHVRNKAALVDRVVDAIVAQATPPPSGLDWHAHLQALASGWAGLLAAHPNAVQLIGARPSRALGLLDASGDSHAILTRAGFSPDVADDMLRTLVVVVVGHAEVTQAGAGGPDPDAWLERTISACLAGATAILDAPRSDASVAVDGPTSDETGLEEEPLEAAEEPAAAPPPRPGSTHFGEPPRRGGIASRLLRRAGSLLGGEDD